MQKSGLEEKAEEIINSEWFAEAVQRTALFKYLMDHRDTYTNAKQLWKGVLKAHSRSKAKRKSDYDFDASVRQSCLDLRNALENFAHDQGGGWYIDLPAAVQGKGWQIQFVRLDDKGTATQLFWKAHLADDAPVTLVYTEQLFFQDWPEHLIFRYYHLNAEHPKQALADLKERHPEFYKESLTIAHPYVSAGEIEARDRIVRWFEKNALHQVKTAVSRRMNPEEAMTGSAILFRTPATNRLLKTVLKHQIASHLCFSLKEVTLDGRCYGRVTVKNCNDEKERRRLARYNATFKGDECTIDYSPEQGLTFAILTRLRGFEGNSCITIFYADIGRPVAYMAKLCTSDDLLEPLRKKFNWPEPLPQSFEVLFAIPMGSIATDFLGSDLIPITIRVY